MMWSDVIEILKIAGIGYLVIDVACFAYVWFWKEFHYQFHILLFYVPFTGVVLILSDYKKMLMDMSEAFGRGII